MIFAPQRVRLCFLPDRPRARRRASSWSSRSTTRVAWRASWPTRGEGLHHVCFLTDDLPASLEALAAAEAELIDREPRPGAHGTVAFVHPRTLNGVLWELLEVGPARALLTDDARPGFTRGAADSRSSLGSPVGAAVPTPEPTLPPRPVRVSGSLVSCGRSRREPIGGERVARHSNGPER